MIKKMLVVLSSTALLAFSAFADTWMDTAGFIWSYSVSGDAAEITGVSPANGDIAIPANILSYSVTGIGIAAFSYCSGLTSVTIPDSVTSIDREAFSGCSGLTSVTIPDSVTNIGESAFSYCSGLTSVTIPDGVTSIPVRAFADCGGLTSVTISDSVVSIDGSAFGGCNGILEFVVDSGNQNFKSTDGFLLNKEGSAIVCLPRGKSEIVIPDGVTSIGGYAFYGCSWLTSVTIPDSVTSIGGSAFYGCSWLTSVTIPDSVTSIGSDAFSGCGNLYDTSTIPGLILIDGWICGRTSKPSGVLDLTDVRGICVEAFSLCWGLTSVTIGNSVTSIGYRAFSGCSGLTSVTIGNSVTSIGDYAFYQCSGLTSVTIPNNVTDIGEWAFFGCSGLTSVTIGNSVTNIGKYAFSDCSGLTSVTIPDGVTSIGRNAFYGCTGLTSVTIPDSVTSIGSSAFYNCSGLKSIQISEMVSSNVIASALRFQNYEFCKDYECNDYGNSPGHVGICNVVLPESVTSVCDRAFFGLASLTNVFFVGRKPEIIRKGAVYSWEYSADFYGGSYYDIYSDGYFPCSDFTFYVTENWGEEDTVYYYPGYYYLRKRLDIVHTSISISPATDGIYLYPEGSSSVKVSVVTNNFPILDDVTIRITKDGSDPTAESEEYRKFSASGKMTVKAAVFLGSMRISSIATARFGNAPTEAPAIVFGDGGETDGDIFYFGNQPVVLSCATAGAAIHYTLDGTAPTAESPLYTAPFTISETTTVRAVAIGTGEAADSEVVGRTFTRLRHTVPDPAIAFGDGDTEGDVFYHDGQTVALTCGLAAAEIRYTLDGSEPTAASALYDGPFAISGTTTVKAIAVCPPDYLQSGVAARTLTRDYRTGDVLGLPSREFVTGGNAEWHPVSGGAAMAAGTVGNDQVSWIETTVTRNGTIGFEWKVLCELDDTGAHDWDHGVFTIDGVEMSRIDGDMDWTNETFTISTGGAHVLRWAFVKDESDGVAGEGLWLRNLRWTDGPAIVSAISYVGLEGATHTNPGTYVEGSALDFAAPSGRTGYTFAGWTPSGIAAETTGAVTARAAWTANGYSIVYNANGGTGTMNATAATYDAEAMVAYNGFTRAGWRFLGWATAADGAVVYAEGAAVSNLTAEANGVVALYAVWEKISLAAPVVTPVDGSAFSGDSCTVTITCATEGAAIYYRVGARPKKSSKFLYSGPFEITETSTIYAFSANGDEQSADVVATITKVVPLTLKGVLGVADGVVLDVGGAAGWTAVADANARTGGSCAKSGEIGDDEESVLTATVGGPGTISFWWKTSCEEDELHEFDHVEFLIDDSEIVRLDGETGWVQVTAEVSGSGPHVLMWKYVKDDSEFEGEDCAWLDDVVWTPAAIVAPSIAGDANATVTGDATAGYVVTPTLSSGAVEVVIPSGLDASKVTVNVAPTVASVTPNGAAVKVMKNGHDITPFLDIPSSGGAVLVSSATVKDEFAREPLDTAKGAVIDLKPNAPSLTTPATRPGLTYTLREGVTLGDMTDGASKVGDGQPWTPAITVKGGASGFYSIKVEK